MQTQKILIIDNYDSFTYNLYQLIGSINHITVNVVRNDEITIDEIIEHQYMAIVLSPGPGNPENPRDFGICSNVIQELQGQIPILGVCLGHQGMGFLLNGNIIRARRILHGKTSRINHSGNGLFKNIPQNIKVARYHSLIIEKESLPDDVEITAETKFGEVMAIQHRILPLYGVQFHPESFMTQYGRRMMENFLETVKLRSKITIEV